MKNQLKDILHLKPQVKIENVPVVKKPPKKSGRHLSRSLAVQVIYSIKLNSQSVHDSEEFLIQNNKSILSGQIMSF